MSPANAISVDVEDYFQTEAMSEVAPRERWEGFPCHVEANTNALFELFAKYDVKATFFFLGWVAKKFPSLVSRASELGHEVGCHGFWHRPVFRLTPREFQEDTYRAKRVIEEASGTAVLGYRAPCFSITEAVPWAYDILEELGFHYDSSVNPIHHGFYGNPNALRQPYRVRPNLLELPLATWRVFGQNVPVAGGAYLRILPYALMRSGLRSINEVEQRSAILYLHPWEIDPEQPRLAASAKSRLRQYLGLSGMKSKLEILLRQFQLGTIRDIVYLPAEAELHERNGVQAATQEPARSRFVQV